MKCQRETKRPLESELYDIRSLSVVVASCHMRGTRIHADKSNPLEQLEANAICCGGCEHTRHLGKLFCPLFQLTFF